jgi:hypothetical protein
VRGKGEGEIRVGKVEKGGRKGGRKWGKVGGDSLTHTDLHNTTHGEYE